MNIWFELCSIFSTFSYLVKKKTFILTPSLSCCNVNTRLLIEIQATLCNDDKLMAKWIHADVMDVFKENMTLY